MSDVGAHAVAALFSRGRLTTIPRKAVHREQLLAHLTETLERDREYTEREINDALPTVHETARRSAATWWKRDGSPGPGTAAATDACGS